MVPRVLVPRSIWTRTTVLDAGDWPAAGATHPRAATERSHAKASLPNPLPPNIRHRLIIFRRPRPTGLRFVPAYGSSLLRAEPLRTDKVSSRNRGTRLATQLSRKQARN